MAVIFAWLRGFLPALFGLGLQAWFAIRGIKLGWRLIIIGTVASLLPLPDFVEDLPARIESLPNLFLYFAELVQLQFGIYVLISAFTFRWIWSQVSKSLE